MEEKMNDKRVIVSIEMILASIAWVDFVNDYVRMASGIVALAVGIVALFSWMKKLKSQDLDNKIKEQQYLKMKQEYLDKFGQMPEKEQTG
jgi:hypothetical protein